MEIRVVRRSFRKGTLIKEKSVSSCSGRDTCVAYDALTIVLKANERASVRTNERTSCVAQSALCVVRRSGIVAAHYPTTIRELLSVPSAFRAANPISSLAKANSFEIRAEFLIPSVISGFDLKPRRVYFSLRSCFEWCTFCFFYQSLMLRLFLVSSFQFLFLALMSFPLFFLPIHRFDYLR